MGTRGFWGVRDNGRTRFTYNHFDSYPSGLGVDMANFVKSTDLVRLGDRVFDLTLVEEQDNPSAEQMQALVEAGTWQQVSDGNDWYAALRGTQGDPRAMIDSGFWLNLGFDPLVETETWLEWGYLLDLDAGELVVYEMVRNGVPKVRRRIPFADLVSVDAHELMNAIEKED